jgi:hypothetical protein
MSFLAAAGAVSMDERVTIVTLDGNHATVSAMRSAVVSEIHTR